MTANDGGNDVTLVEDDFMICVDGFYSDHSKNSHPTPNTGTEGEGVPADDAAYLHPRRPWMWMKSNTSRCTMP